MSERAATASAAVAAGALLAAERQAQRLTIDDVSRYLKLAPAQVEALESGAHERLPGRVFVRGFLRNYAKLLGIEAEPLLRAIEAEQPPPSTVRETARARPVEMPREHRSRWVRYAAVAAIGVALLAVYEFGFNDERAAPEALSPVPAESGPPVSEPMSTVALPQAHTPAELTVSAAGTGGAAAGAADPARGEHRAGPEARSAPAAPAGERQLHFRFEQDSWVEVRDREARVIFTRLNRANTEERVSGMPPLKLVIGNARSVRLTLDGEPVDLRPHITSSVARLTLP
jgi:cytoskeleton protein RodZ